MSKQPGQKPEDKLVTQLQQLDYIFVDINDEKELPATSRPN